MPIGSPGMEGGNPEKYDVVLFGVEPPQPRNRLDPKFSQLVDDIYARMTARSMKRPTRDGHFPGTGISKARQLEFAAPLSRVE
jgi:hypothetical protein